MIVRLVGKTATLFASQAVTPAMKDVLVARLVKTLVRLGLLVRLPAS